MTAFSFKVSANYIQPSSKKATISILSCAFYVGCTAFAIKTNQVL